VLLVERHGDVRFGAPADTQVACNDAGLIDADLSKGWSCTCSKAHQGQTNRSHAILQHGFPWDW
jgi:hypothetical protein